MSSCSVKLENVTFSYDSTLILDNVNISITSNGIFLLKGKNGVGKSTVIKLLTGIFTNYQGKILLNETDIEKLDTTDICDIIFWNMQKIPIFEDTLIKNVFLKNKITPEQVMFYKKMINLLEITDLDSDDNITDSSISGGQMQKIGIIRTLLSNKKILIFDEPTANLDTISINTFVNILHGLSNEKIIIIVTHDNYFDKMSTQIIDV